VSRRAAAALPALALALAACAGGDWVYEKKGATATRLDHDLATCRQEATDPKAFAVLPAGRVDRETLNRCMERKGYTVKRAE
jgi:hypothetical protein